LTDSHDSALAALDAFWNVIRKKADEDQKFASALVAALGVPIEFKVETPPDAEGFARIVNYIEPRIIAKRGEAEFREIFTALSDPQKKTVIKAYNLASSDAVTGKRGPALVDLLWEAASAQEKRMAQR